MKYSREEAMAFINGAKICVGTRGEEVNDKLNEIYQTENPLPDYPFVYIIDNKPVWGASPRKFNNSDAEEIRLEDFLEMEIEEECTVIKAGSIMVDSDLFFYIGKDDCVTSIICNTGSFTNDNDKIINILAGHLNLRYATEEEIKEFDEILKDHYFEIVDGKVVRNRVWGDNYFSIFVRLENEKLSFSIRKERELFDSASNFRYEGGNYYHTEKEAIDAKNRIEGKYRLGGVHDTSES